MQSDMITCISVFTYLTVPKRKPERMTSHSPTLFTIKLAKMKHLAVFLLFLGLISCNNKNHLEKVSAGSHTIQDSLSLIQIIQNDWPLAYKEQDTLLIEQILADNFTVIFSSGLWSDKQGEISWIAENETTTDSLIRDIKRFEFLGNNTAIIAGTGHVYNNGNHSSYEFTDVFIKNEGVWRATASHVSGVKDVE